MGLSLLRWCCDKLEQTWKDLQSRRSVDALWEDWLFGCQVLDFEGHLLMPYHRVTQCTPLADTINTL